MASRSAPAWVKVRHRVRSGVNVGRIFHYGSIRRGFNRPRHTSVCRFVWTADDDILSTPTNVCSLSDSQHLSAMYPPIRSKCCEMHHRRRSNHRRHGWWCDRRARFRVTFSFAHRGLESAVKTGCDFTPAIYPAKYNQPDRWQQVRPGQINPADGTPNVVGVSPLRVHLRDRMRGGQQ